MVYFNQAEHEVLEMVSRGQIKLIHLAKDRLGVTDEDYEEILELYGGVRSSKDLSPESFFKVMEHFRELGFEGRGGRLFGPPTEPAKPGKLYEMVTPAQRALISHLVGELGWLDNPARLEQFMIKRLGIKTIRTKGQAIAVIEALKAMLARGPGEEREAK